MADLCLRAALREAHLEIALVETTTLVAEAQTMHGLAHTSAIALGRLMTGVSLLALTSKRDGSTSIQILTKSRTGSIYADCNHHGHIRGMIRTPGLGFPVAEDESAGGRRRISAAVFPGKISVVRKAASGEYTQSSTPLTSGEIDEDLQAFIERSDQVPSVIACDVLIAEGGRTGRAAGVMVQALPDGDREALARIQDRIALGAFAQALQTPSINPKKLLERVAPGAVVLDQVEVQYRCDCTYERVLASLRMFSVTDLAEMIDEGKVVEVNCDLCGKKYPVTPEQLESAFIEQVKARG